MQSPDLVTGALVARGHGLMFNRVSIGHREFTLVGHSGYGGQNLRLERQHGLVFAYLSNGLKAGRRGPHAHLL